MTLAIYTDGACEPNPGPGGWAFVVHRDMTEIHCDSGGTHDTTNNAMEMTAVIKAIEWVLASDERQFTRIFSDSQYVVKGCNIWRHNWKKSGWCRGKKSGRTQVKNAELWKHLDNLLQAAPVEIEWIRGHSGIPGNERADELSYAVIPPPDEKRAEAG